MEGYVISGNHFVQTDMHRIFSTITAPVPSTQGSIPPIGAGSVPPIGAVDRNVRHQAKVIVRKRAKDTSIAKEEKVPSGMFPSQGIGAALFHPRRPTNSEYFSTILTAPAPSTCTRGSIPPIGAVDRKVMHQGRVIAGKRAKDTTIAVEGKVPSEVRPFLDIRANILLPRSLK
ncbi:hypothetical protein CEXT_240641 [Caerostris extrusa]|uniref:Uncharacterized protein n=1 Tax=Caerostris extrusa TaxID=172846 RepID=A0AAV4PA95_CAEEX|nr:hypothetical protein CEXT_240641 [Caerostris extrusa]